MNISFIGTHHFAKEILQGISNIPFLHIVQVITQPDKPVGRNKKLTPPPVKILAEELHIPVEQPNSFKNFSLAEDVELVIVVQYGKIIPSSILKTPNHGVLNIHTSLLPKYRGASPIQSALINGEQTTGVTIMKMDEGLDTGPILLQKEIAIFPTETAPELSDRLAKISIEAVLEAVPAYVEGSLIPQKQHHTESTECKQLSRKDGKINWNNSAQTIYNQYRGMTPWPGIWTKFNNTRVKLLSIELLDSDIKLDPGEISAEKNLIIGTKQGHILVNTIQLEGKKAIDIEHFLVGYKTQFDQQFFQ